MRAGGDGWEVGLGAGPTEEGIADGVLADREAFCLRKPLKPGARSQIVGREDDTCDGGTVRGWLGAGEAGERG
jgi:hypothetical protein